MEAIITAGIYDCQYRRYWDVSRVYGKIRKDRTLTGAGMSQTQKRPRVSLTKRQLVEQGALELLSICVDITNDGRVDPAEVMRLKSVLESTDFSELPAAAHLSEVIAAALADGHLSADERQTIHRAIEAVLPTDLRREAIGYRRLLEREERELERADKERIRAESAARRDRDRPIGRGDFMIAGVGIEPRPGVASSHAGVGCWLSLAREADNPYDRNAIAICASNGRMLGYVPASDAVELAPILDGGARYEATVKKVLSGRRGPIPIVKLVVYEGASPLGRPCSSRHYVAEEKNGRSTLNGCLAIAVIVVLISVVVPLLTRCIK